VRQFDAGAVVLEARHNRVLGISSSRNASFGAVVFGSARSLVRNSSFSRNLAPEGDGIGLYGSRHVRILDNAIRHNPEPGIHVALDSTHNLIKGNAFSRNSDFGILMEADRNRVRRNRFARNGAAINVSPGSRNVIARNRAFRDGTAISVEEGRRNVIARNIVRRPRGTGIYLGLKNPPIGGARNVVRGNRVSGSGQDAFLVHETDNHSLLERNVAVLAGDDGFDIESRSTKLARNRALRNSDLGIEAVRGVRDGGGNKASGNGDPRQCTHVACR
jgi:parallel beta-helix repeat protein